MATEDQDRQLSEDNALKSLAVAECLIDKESLDIIKLSMHNEISEDFRENTKSLSQLYNHLKSRYNNDPTKTIVRLIFALEILGHMRYGYRAANVLKKLFKDDPPALDMSPAMKEDFLFQQLLAIACKLLPSNCYKKFIRYCAKQMRHNQRLYRTPCEVIRVLISTTTLTKDNCSEFMEDALIKAGLSESKLQMYSNQCSKMAKWRWEEGVSLNKVASIENPTSDTSPSTSHDASVHRTESQSTVRRQQTQPTAVHTPRKDQFTLINTSNKTKKCKCTPKWMLAALGLPLAIILSIVVVLIVIATQQATVNQKTLQSHRENTSVILTEANHLLAASLTATEDTRHIGDFFRDVEVLQLAQKCSNIPTRVMVHNITDSNELSAINETTIYALPGSSIAISICGSTNHTPSELERLELILQGNSDTVVDFLHLGMNDEWMCNEWTFNLSKRGYYTLVLLPPTHPANFVFNITYKTQEIDNNPPPELVVANSTLHMDQDSHEFSLSFGATYSCFVATIKDNPTTLKVNVHIQLSFSHQRQGFVIGGVLIGALLIVSFIAIFVCVCAYRGVSSQRDNNVLRFSSYIYK